MFKVVETPTAVVMKECQSIEEAVLYVQNIDQHSEYTKLLSKYGSLRRVQQELSIEEK